MSSTQTVCNICIHSVPTQAFNRILKVPPVQKSWLISRKLHINYNIIDYLQFFFYLTVDEMLFDMFVNKQFNFLWWELVNCKYRRPNLVPIMSRINVMFSLYMYLLLFKKCLGDNEMIWGNLCFKNLNS